MTLRRSSPLLALLVLLLSACDAFGPQTGNTRIVATALGSAGPSRALLPAGPALSGDHDDDDDDRRGEDRSRGGAVLALVDGFEVTITAVQALPAEFLDSREAAQRWQTMTLAAPVRIDLLDLPPDPLSGITMLDGDLPPGVYVRMRFLVSELNLSLAAPLTMGRHTFPAGEPIEVYLPNPWVQVPGAHFTIADDQTTDVHVVFDSAQTFGRLIVTQDGRLAMAPVLRGRGHRAD